MTSHGARDHSTATPRVGWSRSRAVRYANADDCDHAPRNSGYFVMFPDGDISWQPSKKFAEQAAKVWFRKHNTIGTIEWSNGDA
jgi:hypothetical protein